MSRYNENNARRSIFIPEIGAYIVAMNYMKHEHIIQELIEFTEGEDVSFSPVIANDDSIMRHEQAYGENTDLENDMTSDYIDNIAKKIIKATGAKRILKLDISNCFGSFYMHMIPAILLGMEGADQDYKKYLKDSVDSTITPVYHKYRKLDEVLRKQNLNRTNGMLTGPLGSKIIIEGILTRIDKELKNENIKFVRYVDDYEVFLFDSDEKNTISIFTKILKRYGFSLNHEKTEVIEFPYYIAKNLENIFKRYTDEEVGNAELMELFNTYFTLEKEGTKGAIRYLLKSLEKNPLEIDNVALYKSYLLTIIENNERSLTKVCSLLINNQDNLFLDSKDLILVLQMLNKHIKFGHDLDVIWLVHLLIETNNTLTDEVIGEIIESNNELDIVLLLNQEIICGQNINKVIQTAKSWILLYQLYLGDHIDEEEIKNKLNLDKNLILYKYMKNNNISFIKSRVENSF